MKHSDKRKLAIKMLTPEEIKAHVSPFRSKAWEERVRAKKARIENLRAIHARFKSMPDSIRGKEINNTELVKGEEINNVS